MSAGWREADAGGGAAAPGVAYLVGAGPGDPGLLTARALRLLATADVVLYDRLIPDGALGVARENAELIDVGKGPGHVAKTQEETEALIVSRARAGRSVVRLKGGDPFVFGRGGEEAETLRAAGVPLEVVPGVTAGVAAPAYAGIPVTHREDASAVAFVTGHEDPRKEAEAVDWEALARFPGTLCLYMGMRNLAPISSRLIAAGRRPGEPAAAIEHGTRPRQRTVVATLATLAERVAEAGLGAPAMVVIGDVVARHETIAWLGLRPLLGRRIVVTRARAQASALGTRLRALGAEVVELPAIRIEPRRRDADVARAVQRLIAGNYALLCMTSPNGAELLFAALREVGADARALASVRVAAIGPGTARALRDRGIEPDLVPERSIAEGLVEAVDEAATGGGLELHGRAALVARAAQARDLLPEALAERGAEVDVVALYDTVREEPDLEALQAASDADYVTFTSSSTVTNLLEMTGGSLPGEPRVVSIGPVTTRTAREAGLEVHVEASRHDLDGLVAALVADTGEQGPD